MMKQNQWFAVRCCCTPQKVFGFIRLTAPDKYQGLPVHRTLTDGDGKDHPIKLMSLYTNRHYSCSLDAGVPQSQQLSYTEQPDPEIAIYSDDRPIEFWRTIPGFVEAPPTED